MTEVAPHVLAITHALSRVMAEDRGRLLAALTVRLGDLQLAEDALQEAAISAMVHWGRAGLPASPQGWLIRVAGRKALDRLRAEGRSERRAAALAQLAPLEADEPEAIPDERLRLIFTCCHPALEDKSRVALTLRSICGLTTEEIARAFLDAPTTMGQRLSRAKAKIAEAGIPFTIPGPEDWPERLGVVLTTVYLIFTTGYTIAPDDARDLCSEAIFLARLVNVHCPGQAEAEGALALMLLTDSRRLARIGPDGATVPPGQQDRTLWDKEKRAEGLALLDAALARKRAGPFQIKAAIGACQMALPGPDWPQILALYTALLGMEPTPIVRLNHAVAMAENGLIAAALATLDILRPELDGYQPFHAAEAAISALSGEPDRAELAYSRAIRTSTLDADQRFLRKMQPEGE